MVCAANRIREDGRSLNPECEAFCMVRRHEKEGLAPHPCGAGVSISNEKGWGEKPRYFVLGERKRALGSTGHRLKTWNVSELTGVSMRALRRMKKSVMTSTRF